MGKTELTKALAECLILKMPWCASICQSLWKNTLLHVSGAPPGYVGYEEGYLTEAVRRVRIQLFYWMRLKKRTLMYLTSYYKFLMMAA